MFVVRNGRSYAVFCAWDSVTFIRGIEGFDLTEGWLDCPWPRRCPPQCYDHWINQPLNPTYRRSIIVGHL